MTRVCGMRRSGRALDDGGIGDAGGADEGAGTVLVLALVLVAMTGIMLVATVVQASSARHRATAAADLAALAGAQVLLDGTGEPPCASAARTAHANGAGLTRCEPGPTGVVLVEVTAEWSAPAGLPVTARGRAAAGPPELLVTE